MPSGIGVGNIFLNLKVNDKGLNTQLNGIGKLAKKAGKAMAAAFAVKELVQFGKACIDLGSDLAEVQNVVDVAFPTMSKQIDSFAADAAKNFGVSETMAKRFSGTFGSMATAFGFTEGEAATMATTLTGLAGDLASFYNISQDEAYTKLKSVFTGETEALKDLGVVMTQTALDSFALANGFGKTTKQMTEAEKVALRYSFVQDKLSNAAGDFARTSDSWANQVRILSLQFDTLKASIGEGLINILKPVVQWLNVIIGRFITAAKAFAEFTSLFSKNKSDSVSEGLGSAASSADKIGASAGVAADNLSTANDSAKELKRTLAGFDQITKVDAGEDTASSGSASGGASGIGEMSSLAIEEVKQETDTIASYIAEKFKTTFNTIKAGFLSAYKTDPKPALENIKSIGTSFANIWSSSEVQTALNGLDKKAAETLGRVAGSVSSVATSFANGLTSGISSAVTSLEGFNKTKLTSIIGNLTNIFDTTGNLADAFATIGKVFESDSYKKVVEVLTKIADVAIINGLDKLTGIAADLVKFLFKPLIDNADKIKNVLNTTLDIFAKLLEPVGKLVDKIANNSKKYEDSTVHKFFKAATSKGTELIGKVLDGINTALQGLLDLLNGKIKLPEALESVFELAKNASDKVVSFLFKGKKDKTLTDSKSTYDSIKSGSATKTVKGSMSDFFKNKLTPSWNAVKTEDATKKVKGSLSDFFKNDLTKKWNAVKSENATKTIKGSTADSFTNVQKKFTGLGSNIATKTIDGKVKSAFTAAKAEWAGVTDKTVTVTYNAVTSGGGGIHPPPTVQAYASGGYVKANTPQLAVIGDNRRYGEYVLPENKLLGIAQLAASLASSGGGRDAEIVSLLTQLLKAIQGLNLSATVDVVALKKLIVRLINEHTQSTGVCEIYV